MNRHCLLACSIAAGAVLSAPSVAQTVIAVQPVAPVQPIASTGVQANVATTVQSGSGPMSGPDLQIQRSGSGIAYISGGASVDVREAMEKRRADFPLRVSVSACSGQYVVADQLSLSGPNGEFLAASGVGPIVMTKPPTSGQITAKATWKGQTQSRTFSADTREVVNICFKA